MQRIVPHLWFDKEAEEAAQFYMSLFEGAKLLDRTMLHGTPSGTADMITIKIADQEFMLSSLGPYFKFTPAVSFLIACKTFDEVDELWDKLIDGGQALMEIGTYPSSEKYGWVMDRYGLSWQVMYVGDIVKQKITPMMMFVGDQCGHAEEAIQTYTSIFRNSKIEKMVRYGDDSTTDRPGTIMQAEFILDNQYFWAMDSAYEHKFNFNEAISFIVYCDNQEEIDYYWDKLSADPEAEQCGWIKDKFGLSWQITPIVMNSMMKTEDSDRLAKVTEAILKMKKIDIKTLMEVYND